MGSQVLTYLVMRFLVLAAVAVCGVWAQDTYHCPDGWLLEGDRSGCRCFMFSGGEAVTRDDADILCQFHDAWVAELDHPGINYWLKSELLKMTEPGQWNQFWLGAKTTGRHDPNHDNCLVLREYHRPLFPQARDYYWNDWFCDEATA